MANEITLKTRLLNKYDQTIAPTEILGAGEINFIEVKIPLQDGDKATVDAVLMKVGDGHTEYQNLNYVVAPAADVYAWAKKARGEANDIYYDKTTKQQGENGEILEVTKAITTQDAIDALYDAIATLSGDSGASIADLIDRIGTIESDYLKEADLTPYAKTADLASYATVEALNAEVTRATKAEGELDTAIKANRKDIDANIAAIAILNGDANTEGSVINTAETAAAAKVAEVVAGADANFDTLKEIADWITNDTTGAADMANDIAALQGLVGEKKVATQITDAITDLDLANEYDEKGAAADAKTELIGTDSDTGASDTIYGAKAYANALNTAMDARVDALEGKEDKDTTYTAGAGINIDTSNKITNTGVRSVATGGANGTISVNTNGTTANVSVAGLKSAAYTESSAYDVAGAAAGVKSVLIGTDNDTKTSDTIKGAKKYADSLAGNYDVAGAAAAVLGTDVDDKTKNTVYGVKAYAKAYADGLAENYDAAGSAATVKSDLIGKATDTKDSETIKGVKLYADSLNANMDTRVKAVEGAKHTHDNKTTLDKITEQNLTDWNDAVAKEHTHSNKIVLDGITSDKITAWDNEVGAKEIANGKTTTAEVKNQIEAYGYATTGQVATAKTEAVNEVKSFYKVTDGFDTEAFKKGEIKLLDKDSGFTFILDANA